MSRGLFESYSNPYRGPAVPNRREASRRSLNGHGHPGGTPPTREGESFYCRPLVHRFITPFSASRAYLNVPERFAALPAPHRAVHAQWHNYLTGWYRWGARHRGVVRLGLALLPHPLLHRFTGMSACSPEQPLFRYPYRAFHLRHASRVNYDSVQQFTRLVVRFAYCH